jgi:hydrogenase maturation protease
MTTRILVAGIGNVFLGDDGFGPEVVRRAASPLEQRHFDGATVEVVDYGIRGMHLAYDLLEDWDALVLVDAVPDRGLPGNLHVFLADHETLSPTIVIGCEVGCVEEGMGLSNPVTAAVPRAVAAIDDVLTELTARATAPVREG